MDTFISISFISARYECHCIADAPDVRVLFKVKRIDCVPDGMPTTYTFEKWEHQSEQGEHIRFLNGLENGTLILQTLPQQYQISGRYVCTVSNGIPDMNGSILQTNFTSYNYQGKASKRFTSIRIYTYAFKHAIQVFSIYR